MIARLIETADDATDQGTPMTHDTRRTRGGARAALAGALALGLALATAAAAQEQAVINAQSYGAIEAGMAITVRPLDNSDANMAIKRDLEDLLRQSGRTVRDNSPLILTFEVRDELGAWTDGGRRSVLELESRGGGIGGDEQRARLNLFDTQQGGLLNPGRDTGTRIVTPSRYEIEMTLDERATGIRLWQAWGHAEIGQADARDVAQRLAQPLLKTLGQTVRRQTVDLY